jgi:membrane peptidoglycan carboxypeptidase
VLGTNEIAPLTMAAAFAGIANNGVTCTPVAIDKITGPDGAEVPIPKSSCTASVEPSVAAGMAYGMSRVMSQGTGRQSNNAAEPWVPMIGKTGTTDGSKDTWMSGASTKVATVVGVVSVNGEINQRDTEFDSGEAATARHRMWPAVMSVANAKYGGDEFKEASSNSLFSTQTAVPDVRGKSVEEAQSALEDAGFDWVDGGEIDSELPAGIVAGTNPTGGEKSSRGSTITIFISNGSMKVLPNVVGMDEKSAATALEGYTIQKREQADSGKPGTVLAMEPGAGTPLKPGSTITLVVAVASGAADNNGTGNGNG